MVTHTCHPSVPEAETGMGYTVEFLSLNVGATQRNLWGQEVHQRDVVQPGGERVQDPRRGEEDDTLGKIAG